MSFGKFVYLFTKGDIILIWFMWNLILLLVLYQMGLWAFWAFRSLLTGLMMMMMVVVMMVIVVVYGRIMLE